MFRTTGAERSAGATTVVPLRRVFRDGLIVALLNPKTTILYAAFLPQFLSTNVLHLLQGMVLGSVFVAIAAVADSTYALVAGIAAPALCRREPQRICRRFVGSLFIGLGIFTGLAESRDAG